MKNQETINTATALLAGDMCRLIEKRGLGSGLPLVSMLEDLPLLNRAALKVGGELLILIDEKNGVSHEDVAALRRFVWCYCEGHRSLEWFVSEWREAYRELNAIALGKKP